MEIDTRSDDELMIEFNRCNDAVLNTLVSRHHDGLTGFLYAKYFAPAMGFGCEAEDAARDIAQDTWVRVVTHKGSYKPGKARFTTWLYEIGRNLALNELRRRKRFHKSQI